MPNHPKTHKPTTKTGGKVRVAPRRPSSAKRGYDHRWRRLRAWFLNQNPTCKVCGEPGVDVDHIVPINDGGHRLDVDNLQTLCHECHSRKTAEDVAKRKAAGGRVMWDRPN